jgi:DNA (cytosine-5)-methyltransferase 1
MLNHPHTRHDNAEVWSIDPMKAIGGRPVGLAWFSPDCTHFSRAKGGKPVQQKIRSLAWIVVKWARAVHPRVIILENVPEFRDWGPLAEALVRANVQLRDAAVTEAV